MTGLIIRRIFTVLVTLLFASVIVFVITEIVPGDPAAYMLGLNASPEALASLRAEFGFDSPVVQRYWRWISGWVVGDYGVSYAYRVPVSALIQERLSVSIPLALYALSLAAVIGLPLGVLAARFQHRIADQVIMAGTQLGIAIPNFWLGLMLIGVFSTSLGFVSAGGFAGWERGVWPGILSLTLPAIALALPQAAILARVMRTSTLQTMQVDFMRTARAKGLSKGRAVWRHAARNALIPVLTILGLQFSFLLAGAIIIEKIFALPGLGQLLLQAVAQRDLIVVRSLVLLLIFAVLLVTLLVDMLYTLVDPRLRGGSAPAGR